jgi:lysophospholipase L1-like esterase
MRCRRFACWALTLAVGLLTTAIHAQDKAPETTVPLNRDVPRHKQINERAAKGNVDLLFIGDSITQGWEGAGKEVWAKSFGSRNAMNAGIGGDRTQHILWRLDNGNVEGLSPKLAVLMIGTNNAGAGNNSADIAAGVKTIVEKLRMKLPEMKILVLGIFPRGPDAENKQRKVNIGANEIIKTLADGKMVEYLDISDKFLAADGTLSKEIMPDLLHLSTKGYQIWADAIEPKVAEALK